MSAFQSWRDGLRAVLLVLAVMLLPLIGAAVAGRDLAPLFKFPPPLEILAGYPKFSWLAAALVVAPFAALGMAWVSRAAGRPVQDTGPTVPPDPLISPIVGRVPCPRRFPAWGYAALVWTAAWWVLAWTRLAWFAPLQLYTFFPLWLGFIVVVNALALRLAGTCLMLRAPRQWLALFALSAAFWWLFEWLNRFARNWHYLGVDEFTATGYAVHATLCFSTVLPAVYAVHEVLRPLVAGWAADGPRWTPLRNRGVGVLLLVGGGVGLALTGVWPQYVYPALWAAPLLIAAGAGILSRRRGLWSDLAAGDWSEVLPWMLAALGCGFFWEMWNFPSLAKWIYTVPYCERWHLFEMPLLGYTGYLPFGVECALAAGWVTLPPPPGREPGPRGAPRGTRSAGRA